MLIKINGHFTKERNFSIKNKNLNYNKIVFCDEVSVEYALLGQESNLLIIFYKYLFFLMNKINIYE